MGENCLQKKCMLWMEMLVQDIKTQELKDGSGCAITKQVEISLETLKKTQGVQQAVESHRNEEQKLIVAIANARALR